jgi:hypothetical protein
MLSKTSESNEDKVGICVRCSIMNKDTFGDFRRGSSITMIHSEVKEVEMG